MHARVILKKDVFVPNEDDQWRSQDKIIVRLISLLGLLTISNKVYFSPHTASATEDDISNTLGHRIVICVRMEVE